MKRIFIGVFILTHYFLHGQISDDFSDGDFSANPTWSGSTTDFIINGSLQVQLNNTTADTSYLSTTHGLSSLNDVEWSLWTRQAFSPSGGNNGRVYLTSSSADLTTDPDGFYLQLGEAGSNDAVKLLKADAGVHTQLLSGPLAQIATSFSIRIKVTRDINNLWSLYIDPAGGMNYTMEDTITEPSVLLGSHFGWLDTYTMSNSTDFYYDQVYVGSIIADTIAPVLMSANAVNANQIDVYFDEPLDSNSAQLIGNYDIQPFQSATVATLDSLDQKLVHLTPQFPLSNGSVYTLITNGISDLALNASGSQSTNFTYLVSDTVLPGDVIINEFMCDPTPSVGLPEVEFVEIYNKSNKIFDVGNWQLADNSSTGTIQQDWLLPGGYLILTSTSSVVEFISATAVTSFPGLNNAGDNIVLRDALGGIIDSITYTNEWYQDPSKTNGGWTIELINPNSPCSGKGNWSASTYGLGGTPGQQNSIYDPLPDSIAPSISNAIAKSPNQLSIYITEGIDSVSAIAASYNITPSLTIQNIIVSGENTDSIQLIFNENIITSEVYTISITGINDCWGNTAITTGSFLLTEKPKKGDLVINEILFNPLTGGNDWVEVVNNSSQMLDLFQLELANFDNDTIDNNQVVNEHFILGAGEYVVFAEDTLQILQNYPEFVVGRFIEMNLPSYNNDSGTVYIIIDSTIIDKVSYLEDWHFNLLDDYDGKSLERIDFDGESSNRSNWHTAAEAVGFATPGKENSQFRPAVENGDFSFTSDVISPDNDGFEDVLQVSYVLPESGLVADFTIFDDRGRKIAEVFKSELMSASGTFTWDGVRADGSKATIGTYVAVFEAFSIDGGVAFAKQKAFVVAGKL